jgi:tRNA(Ile)-lysidine synthase
MKNTLDTIRWLEQTEKLLDHILLQVRQEVLTELPDRVLINIKRLMEYPSVEVLLYELLRDFGVNQSSIKIIRDTIGSIPGRQIHTRTHTITRDRAHLIIKQKAEPPESEVFIEPDTLVIEHPIHLTFNTYTNAVGFMIPTGRQFAALDAGRITWPMKLRNWKTGDRFHPLGLEGSKKISDFLINNKIPLPDKKHIWILETGEKIAWVVNHRIDDRFRITSGTRKILLVEYEE